MKSTDGPTKDELAAAGQAELLNAATEFVDYYSDATKESWLGNGQARKSLIRLRAALKGVKA